MADPISGFTKDEIIVAAVFPIGYDSTDNTGNLATHLSSIFDDGLLDFCKTYDWRFLHDEVTLNLSNGSRTYNFASNAIYVADIESLHITTSGKGRRVNRGNYQKFKEEDPEQLQTGTPWRYCWWGEQIIYFDRALDADLTATMLYRKIIPMVTSGSSYPLIPRRLQSNLKRYVRWKIASDKKDVRTQQFEKEYFDGLQMAMTQESTFLDSGEERIRQPGDPQIQGFPTMQDALARQWG